MHEMIANSISCSLMQFPAMSIYGKMNDALLKAGIQKDVQVCFIN